MSRVLVFAFLFFIGCVMGWGIELVYRRFFSKNNPQRKWINPGFLVGPWLPLYGCGLCGMYTISEFIMDQPVTGSKVMDVILILLVMTLVMTVLELIAGLVFVHFFNVRLWDYRNEKFNFKGVVCPKFSLFWGILGCFYFFVINPYVLGSIEWLSVHLTFSFFIGMFFGIFAVDMSYSFQLVNKMRKFADEKEVKIHYEELKAHMAELREEQKQKARFFLTFRTRAPLHEALQKYIDRRNAETKS